jgi:hypothetical protein
VSEERIASFRGEHGWLSNFFRVDVVLDGVTYRSVEHAFQAAKTLDVAERAKVAAAPSPGEAGEVPDTSLPLLTGSSWRLRYGPPSDHRRGRRG